MQPMLPLRLAAPALAMAVLCAPVYAACCYFSAKDKDVLQPAQKAFITWDPVQQTETFTVQPKFEGNAEDFGMVIPTPTRPKLDEMPRDFFKSLAVYTILKQRKHPESKVLPSTRNFYGKFTETAAGRPPPPTSPRPKSVRVLEAGVVGTLDYKIIAADRSDDLYQWLKDHAYSYMGDEATLGHYVDKGWLFTVMKIDPKQMKRDASGGYTGEVTPTRFSFQSRQLVYPLRITRISVKEYTEALLYVQAPYKVDLPGDMTYQYQWCPMLQNAKGWYDKGIFGEDGLPGRGGEWLASVGRELPALLRRGEELGFNFVSGQRPTPNENGHIATTLEWAKRLTTSDIDVLRGAAPYTEVLPDVDEGFTREMLEDDPDKWREASRVIAARIQTHRQERPGGWLIREAPDEDVRSLRILTGHLAAGQFLTKIRKTFALDEMSDDLLFVPAGLVGAQDVSEYEEILPTSPP